MNPTGRLKNNLLNNNPLGIGVVGLGTVGQALIAHLAHETDFRVVAVSARARDKARNINISVYKWYDNPCEMAEHPDIDVIVEVAGGQDTAQEVALASVSQGKAWVTANKALLAESSGDIVRTAYERGAVIGFEAAVCGAIPIVKTVREAMAGDRITAISGIMNGTCNYIFARMAAGESYADALALAQAKGYAEADPTLDVQGCDAAHKIALLAGLAQQVQVNFSDVTVEGITSVPVNAAAMLENSGHVVKLIAQARPAADGQWNVLVSPCAVQQAHPLAAIHGVTNAVMLSTQMRGDLLFAGAGAGGEATASAVMADLWDIAHGRGTIAGGLLQTQTALNVVSTGDMRGSYLLYCPKADQNVLASAVSLGQNLYRLDDVCHTDVQHLVLESCGFWIRLLV